MKRFSRFSLVMLVLLVVGMGIIATGPHSPVLAQPPATAEPVYVPQKPERHNRGEVGATAAALPELETTPIPLFYSVPVPQPPATPTPTPTVVGAEEPFNSQPVAATATPGLPAPGQRFSAAMRPSFAADIGLYCGDCPQYFLQLWVSPAEASLQGIAEVHFLNTTYRPLNEIVFRLYPNFPMDVFGNGGTTQMQVTAASVQGQPVEAQYVAQQTALRVPLLQPLPHRAATTLVLTFTATLEPWEDGNYPLEAYYPLLAVHDGADWRLDVTNFPDHLYAQTALYMADITIPSTLDMVSTGSTVAAYVHANGSTTYSVAAGPVRDFALTVGDFAMQTSQGGVSGDIQVNVYTARESVLDAQQIAQFAADALTVYEQRFGAYPYRELDIHLMPDRFDGGWEHPGLIFLSSDAQVDSGTQYVTAHEVAHQWWYGVVGNDVFRDAWLDEAFAQYSAIIYAEDVEGAAVAEMFRASEITWRYQEALAAGDLPIGLAIDVFPSFHVYYQTVYGKGALFLQTVRQEIGDTAFFAALQHYYQSHKYGIATSRDVQQAFEDASGRDLSWLFAVWVGL
jgi:hypothetical protein